MIGKYEGIGDDGIGDEGKREKRTLAARAFGKKWLGTPRQYKGKWPGRRRNNSKSGLGREFNIKAIGDTAEITTKMVTKLIGTQACAGTPMKMQRK